jgi:hypothetical protein
MRDWKNYLLLFVGLSALAILSCRAALDKVTPANKPGPALAYIEAEPNSFVFYSLADARETKYQVELKHRSRRLDLKRQLQDDSLLHGDAINSVDYSIEESEIVQDIVIGSEQQPISILGILGGSGIGLFAGRLMKRKGDLDPKEAEDEKRKARAEGWKEANGKTV